MRPLHCFRHRGSTESETCAMCRNALAARQAFAGLGFPLVLEGQCPCCGPNGFTQPTCQNLECHRNRRLRVLREQARDPDRHDPPPPGPQFCGGIVPSRAIYCIMTQEQEARLSEYEGSLPGQRLDLGVSMPIQETVPDSEGLLQDHPRVAWVWRQYHRQMLEWEVLQELQKSDRQEFLQRQVVRQLNSRGDMQDSEDAVPSISSTTNGDTGPRDRAFERLQTARWAHPDPAPVVSTVDIIRVMFKSSPESYLALIEEYGDREVAPSTAAAAIQELLIQTGAERPLNRGLRLETAVRVDRPAPCNCNPRRGPAPSSPEVTTRPDSASHRWRPYPHHQPDTPDSRVQILPCPNCGEGMPWPTFRGATLECMPWPTFRGATLDNVLLRHDIFAAPEVPVTDTPPLPAQDLNISTIEYVSMDLEGNVIDEAFEAASEYGEDHIQDDMW